MSSENTDKIIKWTLHDYLSLLIQVFIPLTTILIVLKYPNSETWTADVKLSILGLGLLSPMIIQQIGASNADRTNRKIEARLVEISQRLSRLDPTLEKALTSNNNRIVRFALRRSDELKKLVEYAVNNQRSGLLKPREYYDELDHLADLIKTDKLINGRNFKGEIWAMTSFAPDEWVISDGYENSWMDTLNSLLNMGIETRRICIIPTDLFDAIGQENFSEPNDIKQFPGFMNLLRVYCDSTKLGKQVQKHYLIHASTNKILTQLAGFFAIKLTNGDMHILTGETVDPLGSLSAEALFDDKEIKDFRKICDKFMTDNRLLEKVLLNQAKTSGFLHYLSSKNISLIGNS